MISIYLAKPFKNCASAHICPDERSNYIENTADERLKAQRYSVWKLLERGVKDCYNLSLEELNFCVSKNGKWECDKLHFSLSHTDGCVAVALSDSPVGVDVESRSAFKTRCEKSPDFRESFARKIICDGETFSDEADLLKLWTGKESIYKFLGEGAFAPNKLRSAEYPVSTYVYDDFCLSVCGENDGQVKFYISEDDGSFGYCAGAEIFTIEKI